MFNGYKTIFFVFIFSCNLLLGQQNTPQISPKQPFVYGIPFSYEQCLDFQDFFNTVGIKNGDNIASIGAANGYIDLAYSVILDSSTIYIEDINNYYLNNETFKNVSDYYNSIRKCKQTNTLKYVIGTTTKTKLPNNYFDFIIIKNTYHEFTKCEKIVSDIVKKLNSNGKIIIIDHFTTSERVVYNCLHQAVNINDLESLMNDKNMYLTYSKAPFESWKNLLIFSKDNNEKAKYFTENKSFIDSIKVLENKEHIQDLNRVNTICNFLNSKFKADSNLINIYSPWLEEVAYFWIKNNNPKVSVPLFYMLLSVQPKEYFYYYNIGEAFEEMKKYKAALNAYTKAVELDPTTKDYISPKIENLKILME